MENSSSNKTNNQHENKHPKPGEDAGAKIETVTPDTEQKATPDNTNSTSTDTASKNRTAQKDEQNDKMRD